MEEKGAVGLISERELVARVRQVMSPGNTLLSVLLFGSRAHGTAVVGSDYDMLVITRLPQRSIVIGEGAEVLDLVFGTPRIFRERMIRRNNDNNNFILIVLAEARVLFDTEEGVGARLSAKAKQEFAAGPPAMTMAERAAEAHTLTKMLRVLEARVARHSASQEDVLLWTMRLHETVGRALYSYLRGQQRWTHALPKMVQEDVPQFRELHEHWVGFVGADERERLAAGRLLVEHVCATLRPS